MSEPRRDGLNKVCSRTTHPELNNNDLTSLAVCITGQTTNHANRAMEQVLLIDPDVVHLVDFIFVRDSTGQRLLSTRWCSKTCVGK